MNAVASFTSAGNLASLLYQGGDIEGAILLMRKCLSGLRKALGEDNPQTIRAADFLRRLEEES